MDKMITVVKLPADGRLAAIPEEIPDNLTQLQHYVDGYIDIVTLSRADDGSQLVMIVNDCGLIWDLPVNLIASAVYQFHTGGKSPICGNAILCTADAEGELSDIDFKNGVAVLQLSKQLRDERGAVR